MAYNHRTGLVDIFGGVEDLKNKVVRCVGDPRERFTEDALRILRAVRFSAQLGFSIEEKTRGGCQGTGRDPQKDQCGEDPDRTGKASCFSESPISEDRLGTGTDEDLSV